MILSQTIAKTPGRYWSMGQIAFASYCAGPIAACYLMGKNYRELGLPLYAKRSYLIGVFGTFLLFAISMLLPESLTDRIPRSIVPMSYTSIITILAAKYQKDAINEKLAEGGEKHSHIRCFLLTLSILVIEILCLLISSVVISTIRDSYGF